MGKRSLTPPYHSKIQQCQLQAVHGSRPLNKQRHHRAILDTSSVASRASSSNKSAKTTFKKKKVKENSAAVDKRSKTIKKPK